MTNFDGADLTKQFEQAFGKPVSSLTLDQIWWLVKFGKHIRGRCRSNAALNNYLKRNFAHATFREVTKEGPRGPYTGLAVALKAKPEEAKEEGDTE